MTRSKREGGIGEGRVIKQLNFIVTPAVALLK
jgi:hypothetical protein